MLKEKHNIKQNKLIQLYKSLLRSIIDYSFIPLLFSNKTNLNKIERLQNKALKVITGKSLYYSTKKLRKETKIESVKESISHLGRNWYRRSTQVKHHPIVKNVHKYKYFPSYDKIKPIIPINLSFCFLII